MKRVVITGAGSYVGAHIAAALGAQPDCFSVREVSVRGDWSRDALNGCDAVIHVAGLAHQRETDENAALYRQINRDLALEVAREAKARGVSQFVFFSSMSVYGVNTGHITADTPPAPTTHYGQSKWEAEQGLSALAGEGFRVAVLRPPMIYGRGCRGNYPRLSALAQSLPVFPYVPNERSMLYIGTLCGFIRCLVTSGEGGLYFPQNRAYVSTCELVKEAAACHGRKVRMMRGLCRLVRALVPRIGMVGKVFGSLTYDQAMSTAFRSEEEPSFAVTIRLTEVGE